jgi:probable addiction module antidote protein
MLKTNEWDGAEYFKNEAEIEAYLKCVIEDGDPELIALALGNAARAKGMLAASKKTGLNRSGLYHSFTKNGDPRLSTLNKVAGLFGYRVTLAPLPKSSVRRLARQAA